MDQSYSESDVSLSPSQILDRLQVLRQLQLLQRGKLQKQRLQFRETSETSSSITEIVSEFSNSCSYSTFRSLLQSSCEASNEVTPRVDKNNLIPNVQDKDLIEGITTLNLSQESEFIVNSPLSARSIEGPAPNVNVNQGPKKKIAIDEMPILSAKKDFEGLLLEKLQNEKAPKPTSPKNIQECPKPAKKPFLKRGEGMARFGVKKKDLVIQNTKSLPWKRKSLETRVTHTPKKLKSNEKNNVQIMLKANKSPISNNISELKLIRPSENNKEQKTIEKNSSKEDTNNNDNIHSLDCEINKGKNSNKGNVINKPVLDMQHHTNKHPLKINRGKTWAAVLTKEQDDFLRQLKQSDYYKNFVSPAKSAISDASCDEYTKLVQEREKAEQNMFELLENKVSNESFSMENSFFNTFLKRSMECSGESTPLMMQRCLASNPKLLHIFPNIHKINPKDHHSECSCQYTDCSDASSVCSECSCKTVEESTCVESPREKNCEDKLQKDSNKPKRRDTDTKSSEGTCQNHNVNETEVMKANMAEMNAKLAATSELLKERLRELEDEIETFRKENNNLSKLREEVDLERQKFYEEKNAIEAKFNEEKILSEYYLAEEKEKLNKQKQMYEKYVREMRGRLNKKEKDEVVNLKKEISDLKEEIRLKDAKATTTIARLRNQLKIMEKEKANLHEEVEKLKKENRRIQHSNEITRRLTNVKYLEEINKKLNKMSKNSVSEVDLDSNVKYKAFEIERQSRTKNIKLAPKGTIRPRAKSVPNINVTSRYAKYFSQRDASSHIETNDELNLERGDRLCASDNEQDETVLNLDNTQSSDENDELNDEKEDYLEKIYRERFQESPVSTSNRSKEKQRENPDPFFILNSASNNRTSRSPNRPSFNSNSAVNTEQRSKSPITVPNIRFGMVKTPHVEPFFNQSGEYVNSSKSPISILSNRSSNSQHSATVINREDYRERLKNVSPEPATSKASMKTNLNPVEINKSDGSKELRFPNGNVKFISADGKYSKFVYYNGDVKENFYSEGRIKYYYSESKTYHTTHPDGLEVLEFPDGQVEKRYKDGSTEIRLPNGSIRYHDPKNEHVREEWRFPDGTRLTVSAAGEQKIVFPNGQVEVHAKDHKRREFPDGTVKLIYNDGTSETRYASGRVRIKDKHGNLIMDSAPG